MIPYSFYGSGMYRKHPNHTYGRNQNESANNRATDRQPLPSELSPFLISNQIIMNKFQMNSKVICFFRSEFTSTWKVNDRQPLPIDLTSAEEGQTLTFTVPGFFAKFLQLCIHQLI